MIALPPRPPKTENEGTLTKRILVAVNRLHDVRCSRNNVGRAPKPCADCFPDLCPRCAARMRHPVEFGVGVGSPDVIGILTFKLPAPVALAFGLEVKMPGEVATDDQLRWHRTFELKGLATRVVTSEAEALAAVEEIRAEYRQRLGIR